MQPLLLGVSRASQGTVLSVRAALLLDVLELCHDIDIVYPPPPAQYLSLMQEYAPHLSGFVLAE